MQKTNRELPNLGHALPKCVQEIRFDIYVTSDVLLEFENGFFGFSKISKIIFFKSYHMTHMSETSKVSFESQMRDTGHFEIKTGYDSNCTIPTWLTISYIPNENRLQKFSTAFSD